MIPSASSTVAYHYINLKFICHTYEKSRRMLCENNDHCGSVEWIKLKEKYKNF